MSFATDLVALKTALTDCINRVTAKLSNYIPKTDRNAANGVCPLDANGKVPMTNLTITQGVKGDTGPAGPSTYDANCFVNGKALANEVLIRVVAVRPFAIALNCAGSYALCTTPASVSTVFQILKNGAQIGTITFAAGANSGTFSMPAVTLNAGDQFAVRAPGVQDATLSDIVVGILGNTV